MTKPEIVAIKYEEAKILAPGLNPVHEQLEHKIYRLDVGGQPVALCGFSFYNRSCEPWARWLVPQETYPSVPIVMRQILDWEVARHDSLRINIPFIGDDETKERFIRWTGCELEATMRRAGPHGEDMKIYARVI